MKPERKLAEAQTPDGGRLTLHEHDGAFAIRLNHQTLMHSKANASELLLGELATRPLTTHPHPTVLIGGLGLGFTLKSVLAQVGPQSVVHVAELMPEVIEWNRQFLMSLNGTLLDDPRVKIFAEDVWQVLDRTAPGQYDALVFDIDNGPTGMVRRQNARLYNRHGIQMMWKALTPGGRAAIWSAAPDPAFAERLTAGGFHVEITPAKLYPQAKRHTCTIYVADK